MRNFVLRDEGVRLRAIDFLRALDLTTCYELTFRLFKAKRSTEQNARYWAIVGIIASDTGHTADEIHEFCKREFLGFTVVSVLDREVEVVKSTANLKTKAFAEYCERVESWAATDMGVRLPQW